MLSNSYPMLDFNLGEEMDMMRASVRGFVDDHICRAPMRLTAPTLFRAIYGSLWGHWGCTG